MKKYLNKETIKCNKGIENTIDISLFKNEQRIVPLNSSYLLHNFDTCEIGEGGIGAVADRYGRESELIPNSLKTIFPTQADVSFLLVKNDLPIYYPGVRNNTHKRVLSIVYKKKTNLIKFKLRKLQRMWH